MGLIINGLEPSMGYRIVLHFNNEDAPLDACFQAGIDAADDSAIASEKQLDEIASRSLANDARFPIDNREAQMKAIRDGWNWAKEAIKANEEISIIWDSLDHWGFPRKY